MITNWLDILLLIILVLTVMFGLIRGFVRQVIGLIAVIAGFFLAAHYYPFLVRTIRRALANGKWADLVAFLLIFFGVLAVGSLAGFLLSKLMRGPLRLVDRLLGGLLGLAKGVLISGVIVAGLLMFPADPGILGKSTLAPYCYWLTKAMVQLVPQELKDAFNETYQHLIERERGHGQKI